MNGRHWTPEEDAALKDIRAMTLTQYHRAALYAQRLPGRTYNAINNHVRKIGLPRRSTRNKVRWTEEQRAVLRREAPHKDAAEIATLIGRTASSVGNELRRMGLPRRQWRHIVATPEIDQAIREAYGSSRRGLCRLVAEQLGLEAGWVKARARKLGLTRSTGGYWTPEEDRLIESLVEIGGARFIANRLKDAGFVRSVSAVENRVFHLGASFLSRDTYNASEFATAMGVCSKTVARWIRQGLLKGHQENPSGLSHGEEQHRWMIKHKDARKFLIENPNAYRLNTVDRYWFIATLTEGHATKIQEHCGVRTVAASGFEELSCHC